MDELADRIKPYLLIKNLTLTITFLVTTAQFFIGVIEPAVYFTSLLALMLASASALWIWSLMWRRKIAPAWAHASLLSDLLLIDVALYFNGSAQTTWGFLPLLVVMVAGFLYDTRLTILYGILSFVSLLLIYGLDYLGILPHQLTFAAPFEYWRYPNYLIDYITGLFLLFALVTAASAYFNKKLRDSAERQKLIAEELGKARTELEQRVRESTELFDNSPVALWEEDYGEMNAYLDGLKKSGVADYADHFSGHPDDLAKCASLIKVLNVNRATLELYGAKTKQELAAGLARVFTPESYEVFKQELIALAQGKSYFESEAVNQTLSGEKIIVLLKMTVLPDGRRVLISVTDLTGQKKIEEALQQRMKELKAFSDAAIGRELKMAEMEKELARLRELVRR